MSVKSTKDLTREQAEDKFVELYLARKDLEAKARREAAELTDKELEDTLEEWNDERAGGEGFENYLIVEKPAHTY